MSTLLSCKGLELRYDTHVIIKDVNFSVEEGEYLCIVGENGSGKTTLLKALLGLKTPYAGEIALSGVLRSEIGYMPQQSDIKRDFPASVQEIVLSGCINDLQKAVRYKKEHREKAAYLIEQMGVSGLEKSCLRELSGGQQQRVLLARALAGAKKLIILDEPVSRLDPVAGRKMYDLIRKINKEMGIAVIMVSHDVQNATLDADYVVHLCNNAMCLHRAVEFINSPAGKAYMGGHF